MPDASNDRSQALAILFADLGGSTRLYDTVGDVRARRMTAECLEQIIDEVQAKSGSIVKTIGDEVMCAFDDVDHALDAAVAILRAVGQGAAMHATDAPSPEGVGVHVGFHYGTVVHEKDDVFGDTVNVAARIVSLAKDGEILTTRAVVDQLSPHRKALTRLIDRRSLKGKQEKVEIFTVSMPQDVQLTSLNLACFDEPSGSEAQSVRIWLAGVEVHVDAKRPTATIGRQAGADLTLCDGGASRQHARVELRNGKAYLRDLSTNGTVLIANDEEPTFLKREEAILRGSGRFGLSAYPRPEPVTAIRFEVKTGDGF